MSHCADLEKSIVDTINGTRLVINGLSGITATLLIGTTKISFIPIKYVASYLKPYPSVVSKSEKVADPDESIEDFVMI